MSIPTPKVRAPQAKTVSAADLLAGAAKKGKASNHLVYTGDAGQEAAVRWLELNAKFAETERELGLARDQVLDVIRPWHEETCARRRAHEATVVVEALTGALRVSFQHRYAKLGHAQVISSRESSSGPSRDDNQAGEVAEQPWCRLMGLG
jgi:hypothetical protein